MGKSKTKDGELRASAEEQPVPNAGIHEHGQHQADLQIDVPLPIGKHAPFGLSKENHIQSGPGDKIENLAIDKSIVQRRAGAEVAV